VLRLIGKAQNERQVPPPTEMAGELARHLASRRLDADLQGIGNQGAYLPCKVRGTGSSLPFSLLCTRIKLGSRALTTDLLALRPHVIVVLGWQGNDKTSARVTPPPARPSLAMTLIESRCCQFGNYVNSLARRLR
jgi:hypothetical protein